MVVKLAVTVIGLCLFEIISSVDNAVINAHVLRTMPERYRKIFLFWGMLFAVFIVRGLLPLIIVWLANPARAFYGRTLRLSGKPIETGEQKKHTR